MSQMRGVIILVVGALLACDGPSASTEPESRVAAENSTAQADSLDLVLDSAFERMFGYSWCLLEGTSEVIELTSHGIQDLAGGRIDLESHTWKHADRKQTGCQQHFDVVIRVWPTVPVPRVEEVREYFESRNLFCMFILATDTPCPDSRDAIVPTFNLPMQPSGSAGS